MSEIRAAHICSTEPTKRWFSTGCDGGWHKNADARGSTRPGPVSDSILAAKAALSTQSTTPLELVAPPPTASGHTCTADKSP